MDVLRRHARRASIIRAGLPLCHKEGGRQHEEWAELHVQAPRRQEAREVKRRAYRPLSLLARAARALFRALALTRADRTRLALCVTRGHPRAPLAMTRSRAASGSSRATSSCGSAAHPSTRETTSASAATTRSGASCTGAFSSSCAHGHRSTSRSRASASSCTSSRGRDPLRHPSSLRARTHKERQHTSGRGPDY